MKSLLKNFLLILITNFPLYVFLSGLLAPMALFFEKNPSEWFVANLLSCCVLNPILVLIFNPHFRKDHTNE